MNSIAGNRLDQTRAFPPGPDNFALFPGRDYRHALEGLAEDLRRGAELLCLVGPAGIGKSMLLRSLRARLQCGCIGELALPPIGGVLSRLAQALEAGRGAGEREVLKRLQALHAAGRADDRCILQIVDGAEMLTREDLALLRRLFGPVGGQLLLVGQPPLLKLIEGDGVPPPDQIYRLEPLTPDEVGAYLRHRLNEAGLDRGLFDSEAVMAVSGYCGGIPRLINLLSFTALADPALEAGGRVTAARIHEAARRRRAIGGYPFVQPPPSPIERAPAPENVTVVVGERRSVPEEVPAWGYGRMAAVLTIGMTLGLAAVRLFSGVPGHGSLSHAVDAAAARAGSSLQRLETALSESAATLAAWWFPPPSPSALGSTSDAAALAAVPAPHRIPAPAPAKTNAASVPKPLAATPAGNDGAEGRLSLAARRHLARLYGERAEYEMHSGRWIDARISILRGLLLAPEDADLRATDRRLHMLLSQQVPDQGWSSSASSAPPRPTPERSAKDEIARLYLQQAEHERENRQLQDAMVSINAGLEEEPDNGDLLEMRRLVRDELAVQP